MRKSILCALCLLAPMPASADLFGGDVALLSQILANSVQQLTQLRDLLGSAKANVDLVRQIHRGFDDALNLARSIHPNPDPGIYKEWQWASDALLRVEQIYGQVKASKDARVQQDADQSVAEAVTLNNDIYKYSALIDQLGEEFKAASQVASPGGAQRLSAQAQGVMLNVMSQSLRAQATGLKLQAQALALRNKKEKDATRHYLAANEALEADLRRKQRFFELPRFR